MTLFSTSLLVVVSRNLVYLYTLYYNYVSAVNSFSIQYEQFNVHCTKKTDGYCQPNLPHGTNRKLTRSSSLAQG